jgi:hypothetical protein
LDGLNEEGTKVDGEEDVGSNDWYSDGISVGIAADVGIIVRDVGNADARAVIGKEDGDADGEIVGLDEGDAIGENVGLDDGHSDGISVGIEE